MKQARKRGEPNEEIRNTVSNEGKQTRRKKMKKFRKTELRKEKYMKRHKNIQENSREMKECNTIEITVILSDATK
jgi:hypothetical protein